MKSASIVFIVSSPEDQKQYEWLLQKIAPDSIDVRHFTSIQEMIAEGQSISIAGIVIDFKTKLKASSQEKNFIDEVCQKFPFIQVRKNDSNQITGVFQNENLEGKLLLKKFLENLYQFQPRKFRKHERSFKHLNIQYSFKNEFSKDGANKTNTDNHSQGGCFVISSDKVQIGQKIWIRFEDIEDKNPMIGTVKWILAWGKTTNRCAGFGVQFNSFNRDQILQLNQI